MAAISSRPFLVRSSVLLTRCGYGAVPSGPPLIAPSPSTLLISPLQTRTVAYGYAERIKLRDRKSSLLDALALGKQHDGP